MGRYLIRKPEGRMKMESVKIILEDVEIALIQDDNETDTSKVRVDIRAEGSADSLSVYLDEFTIIRRGILNWTSLDRKNTGGILKNI